MSQRPIIILGMHRSGTSCLAGSLQQRGLHLGEVYESRPHNRKGNRENQRVMDVNNAVLARSGGAWDQPPTELCWGQDNALERAAIISELDSGASGRAWGFKDPRTLLTWPFWLEQIPEPRFVATYRHPRSVARSLSARDRTMTPDQGLQLWLEYNRRLLALHERAPFPVLCFDVTAQEYRQTVDRAAGVLGLRGRTSDEEEFFEDELRTHEAASADLPAEYLEVLDALARAASAWR